MSAIARDLDRGDGAEARAHFGESAAHRIRIARIGDAWVELFRNIPLLVQTFEFLKTQNEPVLLHIQTTKGKGYAPALEQPDKFHGLGKFEPKTGKTAAAALQGQVATAPLPHPIAPRAERAVARRPVPEGASGR